jgi:hypothetical protein
VGRAQSLGLTYTLAKIGVMPLKAAMGDLTETRYIRRSHVPVHAMIDVYTLSRSARGRVGVSRLHEVGYASIACERQLVATRTRRQSAAAFLPELHNRSCEAVTGACCEQTRAQSAHKRANAQTPGRWM